MNIKKRDAFRLFLRFVAAGLVNTGVGFGVIVTLDLGLHIPPGIANAVGYAVGIAVAWVAHRWFVFRPEDAGWGVRLRYAVTVLFAFAVNLLILNIGRANFSDSPFSHLVAQGFGVLTYSIIQFMLMRFWVFPMGRTTTHANVARG